MNEIINHRAVPPGGGGVGGVTRGAQLAGRGPWHAGIAKFLKNEGFHR